MVYSDYHLLWPHIYLWVNMNTVLIYRTLPIKWGIGEFFDQFSVLFASQQLKMTPNIITEINFKTARSGGAGGQNVNKVETMVEGYWHINESRLFSAEQKLALQSKLANRINKDGVLLVKSQVHRSQLANKEEVIKKMNDLVKKALEKKKARIASKPTKAAKEKRIVGKKQLGEKKLLRQRVGW